MKKIYKRKTRINNSSNNNKKIKKQKNKMKRNLFYKYNNN